MWRHYVCYIIVSRQRVYYLMKQSSERLIWEMYLAFKCLEICINALPRLVDGKKTSVVQGIPSVQCNFWKLVKEKKMIGARLNLKKILWHFFWFDTAPKRLKSSKGKATSLSKKKKKIIISTNKSQAWEHSGLFIKVYGTSWWSLDLLFCSLVCP